MASTISKSKYLSGLQCPKLLWTQYNDKDALPPTDEATQAIFETGHAVGDLAKPLYPDGIEVPWGGGIAATVTATRDLLPRRRPIFEASFDVDGCYCRADIMVPAGDDAWDLYEVKSATRVKDVNVSDIAFQAHAIERAGVKLDRLYLMHVDNGYVRHGDVDPEGLFLADDVTDQARARQPEVAGQVAAMHRVIAGPRPDTAIGMHCTAPYSCDLWPRCAAHLPEHHVLQLYRIRKAQAFALIEGGTAAIPDIPGGSLSPSQRIQQTALTSGVAQIDSSQIRAWLDNLVYPLWCLDFESMNPAVPLVDGTRPYQQVPFQFSLHVVDGEDAEPRHVEYLATGADDPRPGLIEALKAIGPEGTILAYNMGFERRVIRELAEASPADDAFLQGLDDRFMDLMTPFSCFWYHDARQDGSCSLKHVLPVLTDTSYAGMTIADGGKAQREFQRVVFGNVEADEKARVIADLLAYCRQDTQALVDVLEALRRTT